MRKNKSKFHHCNQRFKWERVLLWRWSNQNQHFNSSRWSWSTGNRGKRHKDGKYTVTYTLQRAGQNRVEIQIDGEPLASVSICVWIKRGKSMESLILLSMTIVKCLPLLTMKMNEFSRCLDLMRNSSERLHWRIRPLYRWHLPSLVTSLLVSIPTITDFLCWLRLDSSSDY